MENVSYCPYRQSVNWSNIQTTQFEQPVTFSGKVQVTQYTEPLIFNGDASNVEELIEAHRDKPDLQEGKLFRLETLEKADGFL
jgi:hypothetical protein